MSRRKYFTDFCCVYNTHCGLDCELERGKERGYKARRANTKASAMRLCKYRNIIYICARVWQCAVRWRIAARGLIRKLPSALRSYRSMYKSRASAMYLRSIVILHKRNFAEFPQVTSGFVWYFYTGTVYVIKNLEIQRYVWLFYPSPLFLPSQIWLGYR